MSLQDESSDEEFFGGKRERSYTPISYGDLLAGENPLQFSPGSPMLISPEKLVTAYNSIVQDVQEDNVKQEFSKLVEIEKNILKAALTTLGACTNMTQVAIPGGTNKLQDIIVDQPENPVIYSWLFCANMRAYVDLDNLFNANAEAVRATISNIENMTKSGIYGELWRAEIMSLEHLAYIKTSKKDENTARDNMTHEFFIGYFLNQIRDKVPNFMYVYGLFACNRIDWGRPCYNPLGRLTDSEHYMLIERVYPGQTLNEFSKNNDMDFNFFMSMYLQVMAAMAIAYDMAQFTHYDLHTNNVLIQDVPYAETVYIPYIVDGRSIYIKANKIAKIIDYGMCHLAINVSNVEMHFGYLPRHSYGGVNAFMSNPSHDIFKFTGNMLAQIPNKDFMAQVYKIITRFSPYDTLERRSVRRPERKITLLNAMLFTDAIEYFEFMPGRSDEIMADNPFLDQIDYVLGAYPSLKGTIVLSEAPKTGRIFTCDGRKEACSTVDELNNLSL